MSLNELNKQLDICKGPIYKCLATLIQRVSILEQSVIESQSLCTLIQNLPVVPSGLQVIPLTIYEDNQGNCYRPSGLYRTNCHFIAVDNVNTLNTSTSDWVLYMTWSMTHLMVQTIPNGPFVDIGINFTSPIYAYGTYTQIPGTQIAQEYIDFLNAAFIATDPTNLYGFSVVPILPQVLGRNYEYQLFSGPNVLNYVMIVCKAWQLGGPPPGVPFTPNNFMSYMHIGEGSIVPASSGVTGAPFPGNSVLLYTAIPGNCTFNGGNDPTLDTFYSTDGYDGIAGDYTYQRDPTCTLAYTTVALRSLKLDIKQKENTPKDPNITYPLLSLNDTGPLLSGRIQEVKQLLSTSLNVDPSEIKMGLFGSQVSGNMGVTPDIDLVFYNNTWDFLPSTRKSEILKNIRAILPFSIDLSYCSDNTLKKYVTYK